MCGVGILFQKKPYTGTNIYRSWAPVKKAADDLIKNLLEENDHRGGQGCGLIISDGKDVVTSKLAEKFSGSLYKFPGNVVPKINKAKVVLAHNRAASSGGAKLEVTHPIDHGTISLIHNGTLRNWKEEFDTPAPASDTVALTQMISEKGAKYTLEKLQGAMTCMWIDRKDNTVHIHKSGSRSLFYAETDSYVVFASEAWQVYKALDITGNPPKEVLEFPDNTHRTWNIDTFELVAEEVYTPAEIIFPKKENTGWTASKKGASSTNTSGVCTIQRPCWLSNCKKCFPYKSTQKAPATVTPIGKNVDLIPGESCLRLGDFVIATMHEHSRSTNKFELVGYVDGQHDANENNWLETKTTLPVYHSKGKIYPFFQDYANSLNELLDASEGMLNMVMKTAGVVLLSPGINDGYEKGFLTNNKFILPLPDFYSLDARELHLLQDFCNKSILYLTMAEMERIPSMFKGFTLVQCLDWVARAAQGDKTLLDSSGHVIESNNVTLPPMHKLYLNQRGNNPWGATNQWMNIQ